MRIIAVRHGECTSNTERRLAGQLDSPLTERGRGEIERLAERLRRVAPGALYSSDLARAKDTATAIAGACGLEPVYDTRLRERDHGAFSGLSVAEARARYAGAGATSNPADWAAPGGESLRQTVQRAVNAFGEIARRHDGNVIVVTHLAVLTGFLGHVLHVPLARRVPVRHPTGAVSQFLFEGDRWHLELWADRSHYETAGVPNLP